MVHAGARRLPRQEFDFMLANPPYGKSWKKDLEAMGGKDGMRDPRFKVMHEGEELSLVTRSSDGQMLFLANMASKMNHKLGAGQPHRRGAQRLVAVHRRRRPGREQHPPLADRERLARSHRRAAAQPVLQHRHRHLRLGADQPQARAPQGQVQLIDASQWFKPLRKNLGKKNCELAPEDIERICRTFLDFKETPESKIFPNAAFGYWKVTVERPLRLHSQLSLKAIETLRFAPATKTCAPRCMKSSATTSSTTSTESPTRWTSAWPTGAATMTTPEDEEGGSARKGLPEKKRKKLLDPKTWERDGRLVDVATALRTALGDALFEDHNVFRDQVDAALKKAGTKLPAAELKLILKAVSWRVETAPPVIAKIHKPVHKAGKTTADPMLGLYDAVVAGKPCVVEYEPDSDLRDTEQVRVNNDATKVGYEVSFTRHFYKPQPLRTLAQIRQDIIDIEREAGGLLGDLLEGASA
jgi:type I restriction enzyme M protein